MDVISEGTVRAREALQSVKDVVRKFGNGKATYSFYVEICRRLEVLGLVEEYCKEGSTVLDIGAQPFILSCALRRMGYNVIAFDIDPEPYTRIAEVCGVNAVKCDLEREELGITNADCVVFSEVLEHLHYYYVPSVLAKINNALRLGGFLILTTPNVASLFRRLRMLLGIQPTYKYHVREYTMSEVLEMVMEAGFEIVKAYYSIANDLTLVDTEPENYLRISGLKDLIKVAIRRPTKLNILRVTAYPIVRLFPGLRQLIVVIAKKTEEPKPKVLERWG